MVLRADTNRNGDQLLYIRVRLVQFVAVLVIFTYIVWLLGVSSRSRRVFWLNFSGNSHSKESSENNNLTEKYFDFKIYFKLELF